MTGILVITPSDQKTIAAALAMARTRPRPWAAIKNIVLDDDFTSEILLKDRKPGAERVLEEYPSQQLMLGTYRVALSFEEQPAGIFKHISVSSRRKGKVPGPEVMKMVCEAFGFSGPVCKALGGGSTRPDQDAVFRAWAEEFEPGHMAINVVEMEP